MSSLKVDIKKFIANLSPLTAYEKSVKKEFLKRLDQGKLIREEDPLTHFCVFFWPINFKTKKVLLGHHIKADSWIPPGGHIDLGEQNLLATAKREIGEELDYKAKDSQLLPLTFSIVELHNPRVPCQAHFDLWFLVSTNKPLVGTAKEFHQTRWVTLNEAKKLLTIPQYLIALGKINFLN